MEAPHRPRETAATRRFYDRISRVYDLLSDRSESASRERGLALLSPAPGERLLELGAGTGHGLELLAHATAPGGKVVGLDLSTGMLAVTRERLAAEGLLGPVCLHAGDARRLPFADGSFDGAFLSFTLELFGTDDRRRVLAELARTLRSGGRLAVVSMLLTEPHGLMVDLYQWLHRHFPHIIDCQPIDVTGTVEQGGFRLEILDETRIFGLPVAEVLARRL